MKRRIIIVDITQKDWFKSSIKKAQKIVKNEFFPDKKSLELFDQRKSFRTILKLIKNHEKRI